MTSTYRGCNSLMDLLDFLTIARFGNYIGPDEDQENDFETEHQHIETNNVESPAAETNEPQEELAESTSMSLVVLPEDKQYYPDPSEVYHGAETLLQEHDTQDLSVPIVAPIKPTYIEAEVPEITHSWEWQTSLMKYPENIRNVALVGNLHHGKSSFFDLLIQETHVLPEKNDIYTNTHILEKERGITIKVHPMSLVLQNSKGKSALFNIMDTPGHSNFLDEVSTSSRYVDGFAIVIDVVEGLLNNTKQIIDYAIEEGLPIILIVNKMDRLILELKLPPAEAYYKIRYCIDQVNNYINTKSPFKNGKYQPLSPVKGNVLFASATCRFVFSLKTFAIKYNEKFGIDVDEFTKRLWGDVFYNQETRKFTRKSDASSKRSFDHFVLEPIYKIITHTLEETKDGLANTLAQLDIYLKPATYKLDVKPLLQTIFMLFFDCSSFADAVLEFVPSPLNPRLLNHYNNKEGIEVEAMKTCDPDGPLVVHIAKLLNYGPNFYALGRVMSGTLEKGNSVSILGEQYSSDYEDVEEAVVSDLWICQSKYKVGIDKACAGNWVLIGGIDSSIIKVATVFHSNQLPEEDMHIFNPVTYIGMSIFKVSIEPFNPSELPRMLEGLRSISKSYGIVEIKAEESGEHVVIGTGEMYLDCVLYDLRRLYSDIQIKVSDPVAKFSETCLETSAIRAFTETPNKQNKITIIAEPLDSDIAVELEKKNLTPKELQSFGWDLMSSLSVWSFGPDTARSNVLLNDTLPDEVDKDAIDSIKDSSKQGFQWAVREGPLCDEPIQHVRFKIIEAKLAAEASQRNSSQVISTIRRACYSAFLLASPRLLEPLYFFEILVPFNHVSVIKPIIEKRRGHIDAEVPVAGTPLKMVTGDIPVIDSVGFETDIRIVSKGEGIISSMVFYKWSIVPGDPLDKDQTVGPLEVAPQLAMAREFVVKTRKRKGLSDEPTIEKYLDQSLMEVLKESGLLE